MGREHFKNLKIENADHPFIPWVCEEDLPITFSAEEIKTMRFKVVKHNYKIGAITTSVYKKLMESIRNNAQHSEIIK